uniref:Uncharacterized protein n=1 Tax=Fagus sylvatica TaxID=28930 RepID=A0A2N9EYP1_FAGSY
MLSPALPSRHRQKSGCLRCQEADSSPNRLAATLGSPATGLQSQHLCSRWKDLEKLDPTVQESTPYDVRRAAQSSGAVILGSPATGLRSRHIHRRWKDLEKTDPTAQESSSSELGRAATRRSKFRRRQGLLHAPHFVMAQNEIISKPIHVILDGDNYSLWAQGMCSFLKGRKLWLYVTGQRHPPTPQKDETEDAFALRLEDWDGVNHQIITWLRNTSTPSVSMEFGGYDTAKDIADTPIEYNNRLNTHDGEPLPDATLYRQLVGSLVYLTVTRPDISYAVHIVSQFMAAPRSLHYAAVLRILRYLKGTLFHGLHFSSQSSLTLQAYSDADWAGDPTDRRSTTGYCFLLGDSLISWRSKKQSVVARSSTEAEYRALADTTAELLWLRWLLQDLGIDCSTAVPIHCDNQSAIQIAHNDVFHERTKHIEIDCHFVRHHLLQGTLQLRSVSSQDQLADIFTKPMPPGRFRDLISKLKLVSLHPT